MQMQLEAGYLMRLLTVTLIDQEMIGLPLPRGRHTNGPPRERGSPMGLDTVLNYYCYYCYYCYYYL